VDQIIRSALSWDVMGGLARRSWARNPNALQTVQRWNEVNKDKGHITMPFIPEEGLVEDLVEKALK